MITNKEASKTELIPNDTLMEEHLLGTIIQLQMVDSVRDILTTQAFFLPAHADIYRAIESIDKRGDKPDLMQIVDEMQRLNLSFDIDKITEISERWGYHDIRRYAEILVEYQKRRELYSLCKEIEAQTLNKAIDFAEVLKDAESGIKKIASDQNASFSTLMDAINGVRDQMTINASDSRKLTGSETGFSRFDERSGGLQKSDLIIIAGETSHGKTSLAVSIALNATKSGNAIAFYSLEMKKEQIAARMMSIQTGIPANQIMYSRLLREQFEVIDRNITSLYDKKMFFDDRSTSNIDTIISSIRTLKTKHDIDGAIVDYMQILNVNMKGANKEQQMGDVARRLKNLAKDLDIWIIAISQLNRDNSSPDPTISRLRDSGQIAEAADVVILVYRPETKSLEYKNFKGHETKGSALFDVVKGRNIGMMQFLCGFNSTTTHFYDVQDNHFLKAIDINSDERIESNRPF